MCGYEAGRLSVGMWGAIVDGRKCGIVAATV